MLIHVSGFQGFSCNASIKAYAGMKFLGKTVVKVNQKTIIVSLDSDPEKQITIEHSFHLPFWALSACDLQKVTTADGQTYEPKPVEMAMHTLCQLDAYDAVSAIAGVSEVFVNVSDAKSTSILDHFGQANALTVFTVVNKLTNS
jgi:hypothetical protein